MHEEYSALAASPSTSHGAKQNSRCSSTGAATYIKYWCSFLQFNDNPGPQKLGGGDFWIWQSYTNVGSLAPALVLQQSRVLVSSRMMEHTYSHSCKTVRQKLPMEEKFEACTLEDIEESDLSQSISCPLQCLITLENKT